MVKDIENIIMKYHYQLLYQDVINEYKNDIKLYEKYIKNRKYVKKLSYSQIKTLPNYSIQFPDGFDYKKMSYFIFQIRYGTKPITYVIPKFILLKNVWTKKYVSMVSPEKNIVYCESLSNIFMNKGLKNIYH
jgi:hypothetical protein